MAKESQPKVNYRIGKLAFGIAVSLALSIDLTQMGLNAAWGIGGVLNPFIITPSTYLSFWTWFIFRGIKIGSRKNMTTVLIGTLIEMIPYVDLLPGITVMVTRIMLNSRIEDLAASDTIVGKAVGKGVQAVNKYASEKNKNSTDSQNSQKQGVGDQPLSFDQNQPIRPPTNLNNIKNPSQNQPTNIAQISSDKPTAKIIPINLAAPRDQYREAA